MKKIAKFEKVSFEEFKKAFEDHFEDEVKEIYDKIKLPKRATIGSAGYDFYAPFSFTLHPNETIKIPTGIRCEMDEGWFLSLYPRSGLGFKYRLQLNNTVGIVDRDYAYSDNEGHIFIKMTNASNENKIIDIKKGEAFCQGIFMEYGITIDDDTEGIRNGGFGSTSQ